MAPGNRQCTDRRDPARPHQADLCRTAESRGARARQDPGALIKMRITAEQAARWLSIPVFLAIWQGVAGLELVNPLLFPPPTVVVRAFFDYMLHGDGVSDTGWSVTRVLIGYGAGA